MAGSIALLAFGIDSFVETASGAIVGWRLLDEISESSEDRAEQIEQLTSRISGILLLTLAVYVGVASSVGLLKMSAKPKESLMGIAVTAASLVVMRFLGRDAGMLALIKLVQMSIAADSAQEISYSDIGSRFGVSRTHVRLLLEDAAEHGDVSLTGRGRRLAELKPSILKAFDRFLADSMSGHDLLYQLAREQLAKVQPSASSEKLD